MDESGQRYVSTEFKLECIYIVCKVIYLRDLDDLEFYRLSDERVRQNVPSSKYINYVGISSAAAVILGVVMS